MQEPTNIKIVVHMPEDIKEFEKRYTQAIFSTLKILSETAIDTNDNNKNNSLD